MSSYYLLKTLRRTLRPSFWLRGIGRYLLGLTVLPFIIITTLQALNAGAGLVVFALLAGMIFLMRRAYRLKRLARQARSQRRVEKQRAALQSTIVPRNRRMRVMAERQGIL